MGRRRADLAPATRLGAAMVAKRGAQQQRETAQQLGTTDATVSRLERGLNAPTPVIASALARWLGWPMEEVYAAAKQPPDLTPQDKLTLNPEPAPVVQKLAGLALRLPSGKRLGPWETFGGAGLRRPGAGLVVATASEASASGIGLAYQDREPGRTVEERRDALDAWLVGQGATPEPSTSAAS